MFALLALPAALTWRWRAQAQAKWPDKPVKIVLPFGAGGVADVTARILADKLSDKFGERVVIENMPGPGGINAARTVINAPPDGYTMGLVTNGTAISVAAFNNLPFDPVTQFADGLDLGRFDLVFAVNANSDYKTLGDFIKAAKANPGKLNIGTIAVGGTQNLGAELFKSMADVNVVDRAVQELARHRGRAVAQRRADADRIPAADAGPGQRRQAAHAGDRRRPKRAAVACRTFRPSTKPASRATR